MNSTPIRIILVEPAGPLNVGSVARVMKNMGLRHLTLVNPQCDRLSFESRQMAVHAVDVLEAAEEVPCLVDALRGCQRAIATTGRPHTTLTIPLESPRSALPWLLESENAMSPTAALIFGREDRGLTNEELNYAQRCIFIPTHPDYASLNLAQAVAICCYELYTLAVEKQSTLEAGEPAEKPSVSGSTVSPAAPVPSDLAPLDALEHYYQQLEALLLQIGYLYPHTAASRMEKFRRLFNRAYLSATEVSMLRGVFRQVEWALNHTGKTQENQDG